VRGVAVAGLCAGLSAPASAAQGEMGTGVPTFAIYAQSLGGHVMVTHLADASINFPSGCTALYLIPGVMGPEPMKIAVATMLTAKAAHKSVRFYAHSDNGCYVDFVQMVN
jgi:hypothetical protein